MRISFVGGGTMAEAMLIGILQKGVARAGDIAVGEPVDSRRSYLAQKYQVAAAEHNVQATANSDLVILAVKPQNLTEVLSEIKGTLKASQVVLSIVAGATIARIAQGLSHKAIIRVMPNSPAQVGAGMSVWTATAEVPRERVEQARAVLRAFGEEMHVPDEKFIDMATALSASGPAYVFLFIEALIDAGVHLGMSRDMARSLTLQTVLGSAQMAKETGRHPAELKALVTSPGGTTVEALLELESGGFRAAVIKAVLAAYARSRALGEQA